MTVSSWPLLPSDTAKAASLPSTFTASMASESTSRLKEERSWVAFALIFMVPVKSYVTGVKSKDRS